MILNEVVILLYDLTGGTGGLTGIPDMHLLGVVDLSGSRSYFVFLVLLVAVVIWLCRAFTRSATGTIVQAVRDNERRAETLGYQPVVYKTALFAGASALAGLAGALFVPLKSIASPDDFGITLSITVFVWVAIGGPRTILGPFLAAAGMSILQAQLSDVIQNSYLFFVGILFILIVIAAPDGVAGLVTKGWRRGTASGRALAAARQPAGEGQR